MSFNMMVAFIGGIVVGLAAWPFGRWLWEKLTSWSTKP